MASIVRSGARRLAGSALLQRATAAGALVQRTQASGLDARRLPFAARFMMSGTGQQARAQAESLAKAEALEKIQLKKEELYFLISLTETNIHTNLYNRQLLQSLSAEIKPRPRDDEWHLLLASKRRSDVIRPVGIVVGLCIGAYSVLLIRGSDAQRLDEISQTPIKEQQQAMVAKKKELAPKEKEVAAKKKEVAPKEKELAAKMKEVAPKEKVAAV